MENTTIGKYLQLSGVPKFNYTPELISGLYRKDNAGIFLGEKSFSKHGFGDIRNFNYSQPIDFGVFKGEISGRYNKPCSKDPLNAPVFSLFILLQNEITDNFYSECPVDVTYKTLVGDKVLSREIIIERYRRYAEMSINELNQKINYWINEC